MTLAPGTRLGAYEILSLIGVGGMGEVYRARDSRLKRDVAIKILPDTFAADPERLARFQREAELLATLNHQNIAQIYGVEDRALVLELVEGPTLADRIAKGPIPIDEALSIARQIGEALEVAHERGIIHRDLKPANIKLTADGAVKILDFGLAKTIEPSVSRLHTSDMSMSPTITTPAMTAMGLILGTAAYMSPEQSKGLPADKRSDVWAFGCVFYEMLTGKRPFQGDDVSDTLAAVLRAEPDWSVLPPLMPSGVVDTLRWCLEKDRQRRLRDISDTLMLIEKAFAAVPMDVAQAPALRTTRARERTAWAMVATILVATLVIVKVSQRASPMEAVPTRFTMALPPGVSLSLGLAETGLLLSPDGRRVAFIASHAETSASSLWIRELDSLDARPIPGTIGVRYPFWSPDGRTIAFFADGKLKIVAASGGGIQPLCDAPLGYGGAWSRDGIIVFAAGFSGGLLSVPVTGGQPVALTTLATGEGAHRFPSFLPDGRHFLYYVFPSSQVRVGSLDSAETTHLLSADSQAQFVSPGFVLFARQNTLMAQPFDARRAVVTGQASPVGQVILDPANFAAFSASDNGHLAYRTGTVSDMTQLTWYDRAGRSIGTAGPPGRYRNPSLSPDGTRVAVDMPDLKGRTRDIWIIELAQGVLSKFTFERGNEIMPVWSPDGNRIAFGWDRESGVSSIYQKPSDGSGAEELLLKPSSDNGAVPYGWSPDGMSIIHRYMANGIFNSGVLLLTGDRKSRLYEQVNFTQTLRDVSPNGKWVAYQSNETGRFEVFVQTFPTPGSKRQVSYNGGTAPKWRDDGKELFYHAADGHLMAASVREGEKALTFGAPLALFNARMLLGPTAAVGFNRQYDVMRGGQKFLLNVPLKESDSDITIVLNWAAGLK